MKANRQSVEQRAKLVMVKEALARRVLFLHREVRYVLNLPVLFREVEHAAQQCKGAVDGGPLCALGKSLLYELLNRVGINPADQHPRKEAVEMLQPADADIAVLLVT